MVSNYNSRQISSQWSTHELTPHRNCLTTLVQKGSTQAVSQIIDDQWRSLNYFEQRWKYFQKTLSAYRISIKNLRVHSESWAQGQAYLGEEYYQQFHDLKNVEAELSSFRVKVFLNQFFRSKKMPLKAQSMKSPIGSVGWEQHVRIEGWGGNFYVDGIVQHKKLPRIEEAVTPDGELEIRFFPTWKSVFHGYLDEESLEYFVKESFTRSSEFASTPHGEIVTNGEVTVLENVHVKKVKQSFWQEFLKLPNRFDGIEDFHGVVKEKIAKIDREQMRDLETIEEGFKKIQAYLKGTPSDRRKSQKSLKVFLNESQFEGKAFPFHVVFEDHKADWRIKIEIPLRDLKSFFPEGTTVAELVSYFRNNGEENAQVIAFLKILINKNMQWFEKSKKSQ